MFPKIFGHPAAKTLARWSGHATKNIPRIWCVWSTYSASTWLTLHIFLSSTLNLSQHTFRPFIAQFFRHSLRFGSIWNTWSIIDQSVQSLGSDDQQFLLRTGHHQDTTTRSGDTPGGQKCLNLTINKKTLFIGTKCKLCFLHLAFSFFRFSASTCTVYCTHCAM